MKKEIIRVEKKIVKKNGEFEYATVEKVIYNHCDKAVRAFAKKCVAGLAWTKNNFELEDYEQAARMEIITMFDVYDEIHTFSSMLNTRLDQLYIHFLRYFGNQKRSMNNSLSDGNIAYNEVRLQDSYDDGMSYEEIIGTGIDEMNKSNCFMAIEECAKKLDDREKKILSFLINENKTKMEFAKELGITRPTLDTKIKYIRSILKDYLKTA